MPIVITSRREGFRRCGIAHSATPVAWPDERFSAEEIERLCADPMLSVTLTDGSETSDPGAGDLPDAGSETSDSGAGDLPARPRKTPKGK